MKETCRDLLEYFMDEYVEVGEEWFLNETFCSTKMLAFKNLACMVKEAHEVYHIAIEMEDGVEREERAPRNIAAQRMPLMAQKAQAEKAMV